MTTINIRHYAKIFQPLFFRVSHACTGYKHLWPLPAYTTFRGFDRGGGSQGQQKSELVGFIVLHISQAISMKLEVVLKQFKLNDLIQLQSEVAVIKYNYN